MDDAGSGTHILVGIGSCAVSAGAEEVLDAVGLGANVALIVRETTAGAVALAHVALPESSLAPDRAKIKPAHFADTAVPYVLSELRKACGRDLTPANAVVKIVGGANLGDARGVFNVGKRNVIAVKKALWKYGLGPRAEEIGGTHSRSVSVSQNGTKVSVFGVGQPTKEL